MLPIFGFSVTMLALTQPLPALIHVKIFPHLYRYEPMGRDLDPSTVTLKSDSPCNIFYGNPNTPGSTGNLKSAVSSLNLTLTIKSLATPLWLECQSEIEVIRKGAKINYSYSGPIYARPVATGPELIEVKPLNEYLKGVVPTEMPSSWPDEALQAQAVAARTYATFHILHGRRAVYDVDDTVQYQAYTGNYDRTTATDRAVDETGATVILYEKKIIQAYFSADAGGYTEDPRNYWSVDAPYCQSKPELYAGAPIDHHFWGPWTLSFPLQDVNHRLVSEGAIPTSNPVVGVRIEAANRFRSGRVKQVTLDLLDGSSMELDGLKFAHALRLRSTLFQVSVNVKDELQVIGRGFGHGVGMGQYGARVLAQIANWDHEQILNFYYAGIELCEPSASTDGVDCHSYSGVNSSKLR